VEVVERQAKKNKKNKKKTKGLSAFMEGGDDSKAAFE
jgi:hypothetical protein